MRQQQAPTTTTAGWPTAQSTSAVCAIAVLPPLPNTQSLNAQHVNPAGKEMLSTTPVSQLLLLASPISDSIQMNRLTMSCSHRGSEKEREKQPGSVSRLVGCVLLPLLPNALCAHTLHTRDTHSSSKTHQVDIEGGKDVLVRADGVVAPAHHQLDVVQLRRQHSARSKPAEQYHNSLTVRQQADTSL